MNRSGTTKEIASALSKAQGMMPAAELDGTNYNKGRYATLRSIINAARDPLAKNGLSILQSPFSSDGTIGVTTLLLHESGEFIEDSISLTIDAKGKNLAQEAGSIITYLRRYSLAAMLGIYAEEDDDAEGGQKQKPASKPESIPPPSSLMTVEMAKSEMGSDGILYGEKDTKTLTAMANAITKKLKTSNPWPCLLVSKLH